MSSINVALAPSFLGAFWTKDRQQGLGPLMGIFVYGGQYCYRLRQFSCFSSIPVLFSFAPQMRVDQLYRICFLNCFCPIIHFHPTSWCTASFLGSANCALRLGGVTLGIRYQSFVARRPPILRSTTWLRPMGWQVDHFWGSSLPLVAGSHGLILK